LSLFSPLDFEISCIILGRSSFGFSILCGMCSLTS
jgi:hypothetical protein